MPEPEHNPQDELAVLRAELDQALMLAPEVARVAWGYYDAFSKAGFEPDQALTLTINQITV